jgi:uncharacterized tellurite resistance protein B-like protein
MSEKTIKIEHFKNLVAIAVADGYLDESEKEFLAEKAEESGLDPKEVKEIMDQAHELQFIVPMNMVDREDQLADIVYMAMIDGEVHEKEYNLCVGIAEKLGLKKEDVDHVINLTKKLWGNK